MPCLENKRRIKNKKGVVMSPSSFAPARSETLTLQHISIQESADIFRSIADEDLYFRDVRKSLIGCEKSQGRGKIISLFTGAGGMEIGLEAAGYETAGCIEIDADCRATLRHNRPQWVQIKSSDKHAVEGDVRGVSINDILQQTGVKVGNVALVTGGAPCQPFSNMGKKLGSDDAKNGDLFREFVRIVVGLQPNGFVFENVSGIAQDRHCAVIAFMKDCFAGSGYSLACLVLNAADYGVAQTRKRFVMIGKRHGAPCFPLPTHAESDISWAKFLKQLATAPSTKPLKWKSSGDALAMISLSRLRRFDNLNMNHSPEMVRRISLVKQGLNFKSLSHSDLPNCWKNGKHQGHDTFGRIVADRPAPTIRTAGYNPTKGRYIHPFENRGLSTAEMAAFQSFPESWEFSTASGKSSIVSIGKQIGNAVPPDLATAIGLAL
jgi:DNA (cytosine-5)-methyltransferase 1